MSNWSNVTELQLTKSGFDPRAYVLHHCAQFLLIILVSCLFPPLLKSVLLILLINLKINSPNVRGFRSGKGIAEFTLYELIIVKLKRLRPFVQSPLVRYVQSQDCTQWSSLNSQLTAVNNRLVPLRVGDRE